MRVPLIFSPSPRQCHTNASPAALARAAQGPGTMTDQLPCAARTVVAVHDQVKRRQVCSLRPTAPRDADDAVLRERVPRGRESHRESNRPVSDKREQKHWYSKYLPGSGGAGRSCTRHLDPGDQIKMEGGRNGVYLGIRQCRHSCIVYRVPRMETLCDNECECGLGLFRDVVKNGRGVWAGLYTFVRRRCLHVKGCHALVPL